MSKKTGKTSLSFEINTIVLTTCLIFTFMFSLIFYFTGIKILEQKYDESNTLLNVLQVGILQAGILQAGILQAGILQAGILQVGISRFGILRFDISKICK